MRNVRTNLSAGLLLAMMVTNQATAQEYTFTTLAGPDESPGAIDGPASAARFGGGFYVGPAGPCGVAADTSTPMPYEIPGSAAASARPTAPSPKTGRKGLSRAFEGR